jgi:hypothetical protein
MWAYVVAQSVLAFYQLVLGRPAPFPSAADLFFLPATLLLAVSLFLFLKVYKSVGFEVRDLRGGRGVRPSSRCSSGGRAAGRLAPAERTSTSSIPCSTVFSDSRRAFEMAFVRGGAWKV